LAFTKRTTLGRAISPLVALTTAIAVAAPSVAQSVFFPNEAPTAAALTSSAEASSPDRGDPASVLTPDEWRQVDYAVERALAWLASQQEADGSFPTIPTGQPAVSSLCMLAFAAHGHLPGEGVHGERLERGIDYVMTCQKENGLLSLLGPEGPKLTRVVPEQEIGICAAYNHAISSLTMSELYGMSGERLPRIEQVIRKSLDASLEMQHWPKNRSEDSGGWRYITQNAEADSDLSVTGWELMFLRSARNGGFPVPADRIDEAVAYVRRCFSPQYESFQYINTGGDHRSRCMSGAGILALAHAGFHGSAEAQKSGDWLLRYNFDDYNVYVNFNPNWLHDRYHYALFNSCQGMYQLGGRHWEEFFPRTVRTLLANQQPDGSWPADSHWHDSQFGNAYTTALVVMTLGAPNQFLPVFQR
jgi:hypothetical protein